MYSFVILISFVLFCQVSGATDLRQLLGITSKELHERLQLISKIEKLEMWRLLTVIQQERLRQAITLGKKPPADWTAFRTYDSIIKPENADYLKMLTYLEPHIRNFLLDLLPEIPHEESVKTARGKNWWNGLSPKEQMTLTRFILTEANIPNGWESWQEAIQDDRFGEWIKYNKDQLQPFENFPRNLQHILGITDSELKERLESLNKIGKLEIWSVMTVVQQERLRQAVILNKRPPPVWIRLSSYEQLLEPQYADFLWRLMHTETRLREFLLRKLPPVPHEDVLQSAMDKSWWTDLTREEQKKLTLMILRETKVPLGYVSWREAVKDDRLQEWIKHNKHSIFG